MSNIECGRYVGIFYVEYEFHACISKPYPLLQHVYEDELDRGRHQLAYDNHTSGSRVKRRSMLI